MIGTWLKRQLLYFHSTRGDYFKINVSTFVNNLNIYSEINKKGCISSEWKLLSIDFGPAENIEKTQVDIKVFLFRRKVTISSSSVWPRTQYQIYTFLTKLKYLFIEHNAKITYCGETFLLEDFIQENLSQLLIQHKPVKYLIKRRRLSGYFPFSQEIDNGEIDFECKE